MTFEVEVGGRTRTVSIERTDRQDRFRVIVDGEAEVLDATRVGEFGLSLLSAEKGTATSERGTVRCSREIHVAPSVARGELLVTLDGRVTRAAINGRRTGHAADGGTRGDGDVAILAPMPGRVVRVLVATGDDVAARQAIVVVEAMKMENELRAPRAGRVKDITVLPGTPVEAGRILAVIE